MASLLPHENQCPKSLLNQSLYLTNNQTVNSYSPSSDPERGHCGSALCFLLGTTTFPLCPQPCSWGAFNFLYARHSLLSGGLPLSRQVFIFKPPISVFLLLSHTPNYKDINEMLNGQNKWFIKCLYQMQSQGCSAKKDNECAKLQKECLQSTSDVPR